jgi:hypothetical protein
MSVKMDREALVYAECALLNFYRPGNQRDMYARIIAGMIAECDRKRPLGVGGNHGNLHTDECGCKDRQFCGKRIVDFRCVLFPNHAGECCNSQLDY